jgi:hypothetical protein
MYEYYSQSKMGKGATHQTDDINRIIFVNELNARANRRGYGLKWVIRRVK